MDNGEIAVNYHKGTERMFMKNDNDEVVEFVSKDEVDKKQDKVDGVNIVRKEFEDDYGPYTEGVVEIDNGVYNAMIRKNEIVFTSDSDKGGIFFEPIAHTIDGKYFPAGVKCRHKKTDSPLDNDLRIARMCDLPSQVQSNWNETDTTSKAYILNKPTIPTNTSDLNNDSKFVSESYIEPITSQFENETLITLSSYKYPDLNTAFISFVGTWEKATVSYEECYVNTARTFGINFSDTLSSCSNIMFVTRLTKLYNGTTPVQVKCGDTVVYSYSLRSSDSVDTELSITNITNENGVFTVTFETFTTSSETVTLNGNELTIIIPEDANLRHNRFDPYSERIIYKEKSLSKQLNDVAFSGSYNDLSDTPTIPTKTSEITDDVRVYLSISSWVRVKGESVYTSSEYAGDWENKLCISSDNSFDNWYTNVSIDSNNRLKASTISGGKYNRIKGYAPYAGTLVIIVKSDSQNSFLNHKWYITNRRNNVGGVKQYSVNIGVGSIQEYIFYVEKGDFDIMTDVSLSPSTTIIFDTISLIPTLAGLEREVSQYSPGYMSAADKTKLNGIATGATANIGTVTGVKINNTTKTPANDGTVDLGTVLTSTTDFVTGGSTLPITSKGVYTELQSYLTTSSANSTYEKKISFTSRIDSLPSPCAVNTYYRIIDALTSLSITLPSSNPSPTAGDTIGISFTTGESITTPTVSGGTIYKQDGWSDFFEANATYEIVALYDGDKWLVTSTKFNS